MTLSPELLNTRETALAIWLFIALVFLIYRQDTRQSLGKVVQAFFNLKIFRWWTAMGIYLSSVVYIFYLVGLWTPNMFKDALFFYLFSATVTFLKANKIAEEKHFFRELLIENLKLGIILEFLIGLYTFSLWVELLLVPFVFILVGIQVFAERDEKFRQVNKLINYIWGIVGLIAIYNVVDSMILHLSDLLSLDNLRQILLTPNLILVLIPFLYVLSLFMTYQTQFISLGFRLQDKSLVHFARRQAMLRFNLDLEGLTRWVNRWNLSRPQTHHEILQTIGELKVQQKIERNPPEVRVDDGWFPYKAQYFIKEPKLIAGYYDPAYEGKWAARSDYFKLDKDWSGNYINYELSGDRFSVKKLALRLTIFRPELAVPLTDLFSRHITTLTLAATGKQIPVDVLQKMVSGKQVRLKHDIYFLRSRRELWGNITHSYDIIFSIAIDDINEF
jgi:hypothetical protein